MILVLTDRRLTRRPLLDVLAAAVRGGADRVVLREHDLEYADRLALAREIRARLGDRRLVVAGCDPLGGTAVHLPAAAPPAAPGLTVGRSCHNRAELAALTTEDYVTLSPVYPTASKPGYGPPLTPAGAAALRPPVPWFALGGIDLPVRAAQCAAAGAAGVAVLGAVMRAADPERTVAEFVAGFAS